MGVGTGSKEVVSQLCSLPEETVIIIPLSSKDDLDQQLSYAESTTQNLMTETEGKFNVGM